MLPACVSTSQNTQAYTFKRRILIEVLLVPNGYTKFANACINYAQILLLFAHAYIHFAWELQLDTQCVYLIHALRSNCNEYAYMHEQTTKEFGKMNICITRFGIHIGDRKYLNEYTPFGSVSLSVRAITCMCLCCALETWQFDWRDPCYVITKIFMLLISWFLCVHFEALRHFVK